MEKINVRGLYFDNVTRKEAKKLAEEALESDKTKLVFTPNAEIAYNAGRNDDFFKIISNADILLPDGAGIIKAANILGTPLKEKVAGVDFGYDVAELCTGAHSLYLLGGKPGVASIAARKLKEKIAELNIAGFHDGYFEKNGKESDDIITDINLSGSDVVFVCLGSPVQERWAYENKEKLKNTRLICCLGGSIDIYAETAKRAPKLFIKTNLEWLYRLIKEPRRIGRMMSLPRYIAEIYKHKKSSGK